MKYAEKTSVPSVSLNDVRWWMRDHIVELLLLAFLGLVGALIWHEMGVRGRERDQFMSECLEHRPRYECVAMWRSGWRVVN